jgi:hypothetical protein
MPVQPLEDAVSNIVPAGSPTPEIFSGQIARNSPLVVDTLAAQEPALLRHADAEQVRTPQYAGLSYLCKLFVS